MSNIRLISLALVILLCISTFAGCTSSHGSVSQPEDSGETVPTSQIQEVVTEAEEKSEFHPTIEQKDYGEEFYFLIMDNSNNPDLYWVKESSNNTLTDAIYNRQIYIRDYLGVEMFGRGESDLTLYLEQFTTAVINKDNSLHMMISHAYHGLSGLISGNYLVDLSEVAAIDLDADYWNRELMEDVSLTGKLHLGFSDFNILMTSAVAYNKAMYDEYVDAVDESLYSMVDNYRWTLDKMISLAKLVSIDQASDGKTIDDTFGIVGDYDLPYMMLLQASDINLIEQDEQGKYTVSVMSDRTKQRASDLVDTLSALVRSENAYFTHNGAIDSEGLKLFKDRQALMYLARMNYLPSVLEAGIDFGVLPYPMYSEMQKDVGYRHMQTGGYICMAAYLKNPDMAFETIELLSYVSHNVNEAYYERLLGKRVADSPQDRRMIKLVWDSLCLDLGYTYQSIVGKEYYMLLTKVSAEKSTQQLASFVAWYAITADRKLAKFIDMYS